MMHEPVEREQKHPRRYQFIFWGCIAFWAIVGLIVYGW